MPRREFHFTESSSQKFWAIDLDGTAFTVHFGRLGTAGQAQKKEFTTPEAARKEHDKLIGEKTRKGYIETQGTLTATPVPAPVVKSADSPRPRRAPSQPATTAAAPDAIPAAEAGSTTKDASSAAREATTPPSGAPSLTLDRRVQLHPTDYRRAGWLPWTPLPEPKVSPFDLESCLAKLKKEAAGSYLSSWSFRNLCPSAASPEEAWFWISTMASSSSSRLENDVSKLEAKARKTDFTKRPSVSDLDDALKSTNNLPPQICGLLRALIDADAIADMILDHTRATSTNTRISWTGIGRIGADSFREHVAPYLTQDKRRGLADRLSQRLRAETQNETVRTRLVELLSCLGGSDAYAEAIAARASGAGRWGWDHLTFDDLAGLPSAERFASEVLRLVKDIRTPADARLWLVATGWQSLELIADAVCAQGSKADAEALARVLALVEAPEAARSMLRVQLESKAQAVALEWFANHPLAAVVGLTPVAAENTGRLAAAARSILDTHHRSGRTNVLEAAKPHLDPASAAFLQREIIESVEDLLPEIPDAELPAAVREALAGLKPGKPIPWLVAPMLAPLRHGSGRVGTAAVEQMLAGLRTASLSEPCPLAEALKSAFEGGVLDAFAWSLFSQWQGAGGPSKDKWAMAALGHLGSDASVLRLVPLIREWPGESQHQRAVFGLEVLRRIGTDAALMGLNGIAQKVKFRGLKEKAIALMEEIAASRGLSREELADRIVPDCGLDARGTRVFDFGPRQFRFVLAGDMKPLVRDAAGKAKPDLPAPGKSDDPALAERAVAEWKLLKKTLRETLKVQADRLEDAMISGRRWSTADFDALLVRHPLMVNLVRQLLWASYGADGRPRTLFRVTEDQTLADVEDAAIPLPADGAIGIVHPAHLTGEQLSAWGQIFADYEIIPPFQQLARRLCRPAPEDLGLTAITRYAGPKVPGIVMYGMLERSHWLRDTPADAGGFMQHSKPFHAAKVTAFIAYDPGMGIGYYDEPQSLQEIYFVPGHAVPDMWGKHTNRLKIGDVDPVVLSEVLRLAEAIVSKAE